MKRKHSTLNTILSVILITAGPLFAAADNKDTLVSVGTLEVTAHDLDSAVASSPFSAQFASMDEKDQASLRGDLLKRLVLSRLFQLEAQTERLDKSPQLLKEVGNFRLGMLYRHYMDKLREQIKVPDDVLNRLREESGGNSDVFAASKSAYISDRYRQVRMLTLQNLIQKRHVVMHEDRIKPDIEPDTVLMSGDNLVVSYQDVIDTKEHPDLPNPEYVKEQVSKHGELLLVAEAAEKEGVDVSEKVTSFRNERLPALLLENKEKEWLPDEKAMQDYYEQHPEIGHVLERRHIGQLVVSSYSEAEVLRKRIVNGESLFTLAGQYSIDPYGRERNGDMGWLEAGSGMPQIEQALKGLKNDEVSPIIKTPQGYHLVVIIDRKLGRMRPYEGVKDKVKQAIISAKLKDFIHQLEQKYQVAWHIMKDAASTEQ